MKRSTCRMICLLLCAGLMTWSVSAQNATSEKPMAKKAMAKPAGGNAAEAPKAQWFSISVVRVKPEMAPDWQDLQRKVVNPALKKYGVKERSIWQTAIFGPGFEYVVITPIARFAQYDDPVSPLRKSLGDDAWEDYQQKNRRYVESVHTYAAMSRPDLSYEGKMAKMTGPPKLAVVNSLHITPGRAAAFEAFLKTEIIPVMKRADVMGYFVSQNVYGGDANEYTTVLFVDSFAEIGKGSPLIQVLGQQGLNRLGLKYAGLITSQERMIARYNQDLSFFTAP